MVRQVIIDTNFMISAIENKLDFFSEIKYLGFQSIVPEQVVAELERIKKGQGAKQKQKHKDASSLSLNMIKSFKPKIISLKMNYVDKGIKEYLKTHPDTIVATFDKELKQDVRDSGGKVMVIRNKKGLEIIS